MRLLRPLAVFLALGVGAGLASASAGSAASPDPSMLPCGAVAIEVSGVTLNLSIVQRGASCDEARALAQRWYAAAEAQDIPEAVYGGQPFYGGGPWRFGEPYAIDDFQCRYRKITSDVKEVWCVDTADRVVGWAAHRGLAGVPEDPFYPTQGPDELTPPLPTLTAASANGYLRTALKRNFKGAYAAAYGKRTRCVRRSRTSFRCAPSWVVGDSEYSGTARIWFARDDDGEIWWNFSWTIKRLDAYCADIHRSHSAKWITRHCVKTYRVT